MDENRAQHEADYPPGEPGRDDRRPDRNYASTGTLAESAIRGLMLLGRTREEAAREIAENERAQQMNIDAQLWDNWK